MLAAAGKDIFPGNLVDPGCYNCSSASHPWGNIDGVNGAVFCTCTAFDTGIKITDSSFFVHQTKNTMRTDGDTTTAADAYFSINTKCCNTINIAKCFH